ERDPVPDRRLISGFARHRAKRPNLAVRPFLFVPTFGTAGRPDPDAAARTEIRVFIRNSAEAMPGWPSRLRLSNRKIGRIGMLDPDDMIASIDVMDFAGYATRQIREEIGRRVPHFIERNVTAERGVVFVPFQDVAEVANAGRGQCLNRAR